ncbi:heparinase II/III family protein [Mycolicibacterium fluoranthenivorans]|nr:alginate lyase family protein [Mycolicibacterium fluoranthenivorans]
MSPPETVWRARRVVDMVVRRDGLRERADTEILADAEFDWDAALENFRAGTGRAVLLDQDRARRIAKLHQVQVRELVAAADRVLDGERAYFGYRTVNIGSPIDWNHDPITGYRWPGIAGSRIDHRVAASDPKWIWELNRLQHLPLLAQAWMYTGDSRYCETAFEHLDSWLDQNPIGRGISWRSAFEVGLRAISVAIAVQGLRNAPGLTTPRYRRIIRMLDAAARYCWRARSRFSSANNHVIGELAGLLTVRMLCSELAAPAALYGRAVETLIAEAGRLILPDGAGAEQSIAYQIFTEELLAAVVVLLRLGGRPVPSELTDALDRAAGYLVSLVGSNDPDPRYGDDDDSFALRLGAEHKRTVREHLGIIAAVTGNVTASRYGQSTLTAAWYADALQTATDELGTGVGRDEPRPSRYASHGGLVVLCGGRRRVSLDVGPLGHGEIAAHGHADALGVTLSVDGRELITDPGTASFYGSPAVRNVHRGTRSHPTVCVDNTDQSTIGGPFYWRHRSRTRVHAVDLERGIVDAEHDGYRRLDDPVVHRRWLIAPPDTATVVVVDLIDGRAAHDIAVSWPLHPDLHSTPTSEGQRITRDRLPVLELCYAATSPIVAEQTRADGDSHLGWWSDRLEARVPAWLAGARCRSCTPVAILSVLRVSDLGALAEPRITHDASTLTASWSERGGRRELTIDASRPGAVFGTPLPSFVGSVSKS